MLCIELIEQASKRQRKKGFIREAPFSGVFHGLGFFCMYCMKKEYTNE